MLYNARSGIADQFHNTLTMEKMCYMNDYMNVSGGTMYWSNSNASKNALKLFLLLTKYKSGEYFSFKNGYEYRKSQKAKVEC